MSNAAIRNHQLRRQWQREDAAKRAALRPTRAAIVKALRGLPRAKWLASGRVKGWGRWTLGWDADSDIYSSVVLVRVIRGEHSTPQEVKDLQEKLRARLAHLKPVWEGERATISPVAEAVTA